MFDPYDEWLGIPKGQADYYRLLGLPRFESNEIQIRDAGERLIRHVRSFELGEHGAYVHDVLNSIARAQACLSSPAKKRRYDAQLQRQGAASGIESSSVRESKCFACGVSIGIPVSLFGQRVKCGNCNIEISVSASGACTPSLEGRQATVSMDEAELEATVAEGERRRSTATSAHSPSDDQVDTEGSHYRSSVLSGHIIAMTVGGIAFVAILSGAIWFLQSGRTSPVVNSNNTQMPVDEASTDVAARVDLSVDEVDSTAVLPLNASEPAGSSTDEDFSTSVSSLATSRPVFSLPSVKNSVGMEMLLVPRGEFYMGSPETEMGRKPDEQAQKISIPRDFLCGTTEVTQGHWKSVMGTTPWAGQDNVFEGDDYPATYVSRDGAREFCRRLSGIENRVYDLPSEAEWEYVCRGSTETSFCFGDFSTDGIEDFAWCASSHHTEEARHPNPVALLCPNPIGLYDVHGNVAEWCSDIYQPLYKENSTNNDSVFGDEFALFVCRGGGWRSSTLKCRAAARHPVNRVGSSNIGFRIVCRDTEIAGNDPGINSRVSFVSRNDIPIGTRWVNPEGMAFRYCGHGSFSAGKQEVRTTLPMGFWISELETTQAIWKRIRNDTPWTTLEDAPIGDNIPACGLRYIDVIGFQKAINAGWRDSHLPAGWTYRIPYETEWEYACRAGTSTIFSFGNALSLASRYAVSGTNAPTAVGTKLANRWGIYDMHGNVGEFVLPHLSRQTQGAAVPVQFDRIAQGHVVRGGSFSRLGTGASDRIILGRSEKKIESGFRLVIARLPKKPVSPNIAESRAQVFSGIRFRRIEEGTFKQGANQFVVDKPFLISETELTEKDANRILGLSDRSSDRPVRVSLSKAKVICDILSATDGHRYSLPSEEEWELACRGRFDKTTLGESDAKKQAHYKSSTFSLKSVKTLAPNSYGLYDMYGNAAEWCLPSPQLAKLRIRSQTAGVVRGGNYKSRLDELTSFNRKAANGTAGVRLVRAVEEDEALRAAFEEYREHSSRDQSRLPTALNSIGMRLRLIPFAGTRVVGYKSLPVTSNPRGVRYETKHKVTVDPILMGVTEVSRAQWLKVMKTKPWEGIRPDKLSRQVPATHVSWSDAANFCEVLSRIEGVKYRLPTEAEWELACRSGAVGKTYSFGNDVAGLFEHGWFMGNAGNPPQIHDVAQKQASSFGLFDMEGNVDEWCSDWFNDFVENGERTVRNPEQTHRTGQRVVRGGNYLSPAAACSLKTRTGKSPELKLGHIGFRIVRDL